MNKLLSFIFSLLIINTISAQETIYPIDIELERCIDDPNTNDVEAISNCFTIAKNSWLREIETSLDSLYQVSKWQDRKAITNTQREWEKYFIAEKRYINEVYNDFKGGLWATLYERALINVIKQRAILLKAHLMRQQ